MRHSEALAIVHDSLVRLTGKEPSQQAVWNAAAVAWLETQYGRSGQFGKLAAQGMFNWGAHERSKVSGSCPAGTAPGSDVGSVCFYVLPTDDEAADDYIKLLVKNGVNLDGSPQDVATGMYKVGYYGGFHWAPGCNEMIAGDPRGIQMPDCPSASAANIADYTSAINNGVSYYKSGKDAETSPIPPVRLGGGSSYIPSGSSFATWGKRGLVAAVVAGLAIGVYSIAKTGGIPLPHGQRLVLR